MSRAFFDKNTRDNCIGHSPDGQFPLSCPHLPAYSHRTGLDRRSSFASGPTWPTQLSILTKFFCPTASLNLPLADLLTRPLPLDQVAPLGFLLVERCAVTIFGHNEFALRLFPFVCAIVSLFLFRRLAERALTGVGPAVALFVFAIGVPFIRYAVIVKQYELDVMAAILLMLIAFNLRDRPTTTKRLLLFGLAGFAVISFSQASVLVMAGLGFAFAVDWLLSRDRNALRALLFTVPLWAAASILAVMIGLRSMTPSTRTFMDDFWSGGFLPLPFRAIVGSPLVLGKPHDRCFLTSRCFVIAGRLFS